MARTILVVDDSESLRTMVKSYLAQEGFRVVTAEIKFYYDDPQKSGAILCLAQCRATAGI